MKKRKIKWVRVLFCIIILIFIIGGIWMLNKNLSPRNIKPEEQEKGPSEQKPVDPTNASLEKAPKSYMDFQNLGDGEYLTETGYTLKIQNQIASIDGHIIVNKTYAIPHSYQPENPYEKITGERCNNCIDKEAMQAFKQLQSDASVLGLNLYIASGYRSYSYQDRLYNNYSAVSGTEGADTYSARPGHSEHQTGYCFDLNSVDDSFATTEEGKWVHDNAHLYGFVIRYPKGKEKITGYQYESWHLRYVGVELAKKLYQNGNWLTLEEYYGITSSYQ